MDANNRGASKIGAVRKTARPIRLNPKPKNLTKRKWKGQDDEPHTWTVEGRALGIR